MAVALAPALVFSLKHPVAFPCKRSWHCASAAQTADCFCSEAGCQLWQAHRKALRRHCAPRVWRWPCCCLALLGLGRLYWPVMCESGCVMDHPNASRRPLYSRSALRPKPNGVLPAGRGWPGQHHGTMPPRPRPASERAAAMASKLGARHQQWPIMPEITPAGMSPPTCRAERQAEGGQGSTMVPCHRPDPAARHRNVQPPWPQNWVPDTSSG